MAEWLTVDEAAEVLWQRGVTMRYGNQERSSSRKTIFARRKNGTLKRTRQKEMREKRRFWLIDRAELEPFTPPKVGRLPAPTRRSRRARDEGDGRQCGPATNP